MSYSLEKEIFSGMCIKISYSLIFYCGLTYNNIDNVECIMDATKTLKKNFMLIFLIQNYGIRFL